MLSEIICLLVSFHNEFLWITIVSIWVVTIIILVRKNQFFKNIKRIMMEGINQNKMSEDKYIDKIKQLVETNPDDEDSKTLESSINEGIDYYISNCLFEKVDTLCKILETYNQPLHESVKKKINTSVEKWKTDIVSNINSLLDSHNFSQAEEELIKLKKRFEADYYDLKELITSSKAEYETEQARVRFEELKGQAVNAFERGDIDTATEKIDLALEQTQIEYDPIINNMRVAIRQEKETNNGNRCSYEYPIINVPKQDNEGEDSDPLIFAPENKNWGIIGVFDGMGGSGGRKYTHIKTGEIHTGAYWASRFVREIVEKLLKSKPIGVDPESYLDQNLHGSITSGLADNSDNFREVSKTMSKMIKFLPTTMALCLYKVVGRKVRIISYWAGDSRIYLFDKNKTTFFTKDDVNSDFGDPFEPQLDSAMNNNIYHVRVKLKEKDFYINKVTEEILLEDVESLLILAATDGCFGYFNNPIQFDRVVRESIDLHDLSNFSTRLNTAIKENGQQDDYSFAAVMINKDGDESKISILKECLRREIYKDYETWIDSIRRKIDQTEKEKLDLSESMTLTKNKQRIIDDEKTLESLSKDKTEKTKAYQDYLKNCNELGFKKSELSDSEKWISLLKEIDKYKSSKSQKEKIVYDLVAKGRKDIEDMADAQKKLDSLCENLNKLDEEKKDNNLNFYRKYSNECAVILYKKYESERI